MARKIDIFLLNRDNENDTRILKKMLKLMG